MDKVYPTKARLVLVVGLCALLPCLSTAIAQEKIPALTSIPDNLFSGDQTKFAQQKQALQRQLSAFQSAAGAFNDKTAENQTDGEFNALQSQRAAYVRAAKAFNNNLAAAVRATSINEMDALAKRLGWSPEKQARLHTALNKLAFDGDPNVTGEQISRTWRDVLTRGQNAELVREASEGGALGFPGTGAQTSNNYCVIFALANAVGLPYGVVAARATALIRQGGWRETAQRANPQEAIEKVGMLGWEVVMLGESFGRAEVISSSDFAKTLNAGQSVMVNVVPADGNVNNGHEVVLVKTFQHGAQTWFVMMDSNQGPQWRLFLSSTELNIMLQENDVTYGPEPGTTPTLLH